MAIAPRSHLRFMIAPELRQLGQRLGFQLNNRTSLVLDGLPFSAGSFGLRGEFTDVLLQRPHELLAHRARL
jgi:hypothetical protein